MMERTPPHTRMNGNYWKFIEYCHDLQSLCENQFIRRVLQKSEWKILVRILLFVIPMKMGIHWFLIT